MEQTIPITNHELSIIMDGRALTVSDKDGAEYHLHRSGHFTGVVPCLPRVSLSNFQLNGVAYGYAVSCPVYVGGDYIRSVTVRLFASVSEYRETLRLSTDYLERNGLPVPDAPTDEQILQWIAALPVEA